MAMCAYCGRRFKKGTKDHVIPRCLYPSSKAASTIQRLTVPACEECNNSWSDDEPHFRNMLLLAGEPTRSVRELWETTVRRSFRKRDGRKRLMELLRQMKPVQTPEGERHMVYPGQDARVMRIVRKVVRGLCHYHGLGSPVSDGRVSADVLKYMVPPEFLKQMDFHDRDPHVFEYGYAVLQEAGIESFWLLTFFELRTFLAWVDMEERKLPDRQ